MEPVKNNNYFSEKGVFFAPTKVGYRVYINGRHTTETELMVRNPTLALQIRSKKASLPKRVRAPKNAKDNNNDNDNDGYNANSERKSQAEKGRRRYREHISTKFFTQIGAGIGVPKNDANFALYQVSALFSSEVLQSYSGGELETRAIELAVQYAKKHGVPIDAYKFNRGNNGVITPGDQIFNLQKRTFIFKPRFALERLKTVSNANNSHIGIAMSAVLKACSEHKSKGAGHVETDIIEIIPESHTINLYELKIGEGKSEGFPAEAYQLYKSKRILELEFARLRPDVALPTINMYFLAWGFNLVPGRAPGFSVESIKFKKPTEWGGQRGPAIHQLFESHQPGWDNIKLLDPTGFQNLTGLKSSIVTAQLIRHREGTMKTVRKVLSTMERRHGRWRSVSPTTRLELERTRRGLLVSGPPNTSHVPQGNLSVLHGPNGARWANYIKNWSITKIARKVGYNNAEARSVRDAEYRTFDRKWFNAMVALMTHNIIRVSKVGVTVNAEVPKLVSNSESNAPRRHRGRDVKNYVNKLKILILMGDPDHKQKFPIFSLWSEKHNIRAVPGALTREELAPVFRFATNKDQIDFLNGFLVELTNANRQALVAAEEQVRRLAAEANAWQAAPTAAMQSRRNNNP